MFDLQYNGAHMSWRHFQFGWKSTHFVKTCKLGKYVFDGSFATKNICPLSCSHPLFTFKQTNWFWKYRMITFCQFQIWSLPLLDTPCYQAPGVQSWLLGVCLAPAIKCEERTLRVPLPRDWRSKVVTMME